MPIKQCSLPNGDSGYKWGDSGKCYRSKKDAIKQMLAIKFSQSQGFQAETLKEYIVELTDEELCEICTDLKVSTADQVVLLSIKNDR